MNKAPNAWQGIVREYAEHLPITDSTPIITLQEGNTPLIPVPNFVDKIGGKFSLFVKFEGLNPTCSFKDRGMTMAMSKAAERGAKVAVCASTGNTSAAAAAYASRAGIKCAVLIPDGKIALGKLAQALMYGAQTVAIEGNFDQALEIVRELGQDSDIEIVNSINPFRIEGQKTASFEICDQLGRAPDFHFTPVGNAGNITAYWKGFKEYHSLGKISSLPKMVGFQAAGAAPIVHGSPVENPETLATAIRIGNPASWKKAEEARDESTGLINAVTDDEILNAYKLISQTEGILAEPASAASLAGVIKISQESPDLIPADSIITATLTGHGLKDPDIAIETAGFQPIRTQATYEAVSKVLKS